MRKNSVSSSTTKVENRDSSERMRKVEAAYIKAEEDVDAARETLRARYKSYRAARNEAKEADARFQEAAMRHQFAHDEYMRIRDNNKARIAELRQEANREPEGAEELNREIENLCQETKAAKRNITKAPIPDGSPRKEANAKLDAARQRYEISRDTFKRLKSKRDHLKSELCSLQTRR